MALCSQVHHYRRCGALIATVSQTACSRSDELRLDVARSRVRVEADYHSGGREGGQTSMCELLLPRRFFHVNNLLWYRFVGWDTAGTESFRSITRSYYRGAAGCLLVYDVCSRQSFLNARTWLKDVRQHADPHLTCILVGNKTDLCSDDAGPTKRNREVTTEEAELWAKEEGLLFVETSARSGENVELAFEQATRDILMKIRNGVFEDDRSPGVKTSKPSGPHLGIEESAKSGCCS